MARKLEKILAMDLDELNEAYIEKMLELKKPVTDPNQPSLFEIYQTLIPGVFVLAEDVRRSKLS